MWAMADEHIDLDNIKTNDIYAILKTYGVEAARQAIITEMSNVFGPYGIKVDYRHLTVVADYMVCLLAVYLNAQQTTSLRE
jgi:DNA-directed RNA polymerase I subunit RPA1